MRKTALALAACAALSASVARGSVSQTYTNLGVPDDGSGPLTGYTAFLISLHSNSGKITGVDFSNEGAPGKDIEFAQKAIHQVWFKQKKVILTSETGTFNGVADSIDSFFIENFNAAATPGDWSLGISPSEDNDAGGPGVGSSPRAGDNAGTATSAVGDRYGGGNFMRIAYGINAGSQVYDMDVAYVVLNNAAMTWHIASPIVAIEGEGEYQVAAWIPEPGALLSVSMLMLGLRWRPPK